ncbi:hypothetical protein SEA_GETALONG_64 [Gordonia phage Getalong]|uniref:Uncharacterized protein n=1 Tax=Gordonia phage Getalong TaxID=2315531 RepID=A0A386KFG2_9CAUD|nr:hypothetical protein HOU38_gp064 [Gordonia phage Getalong]AYD83924.1 hypothetical protein SEA_GETALONG_64 [Gordonia phage Getalong]
MTAADEARSLLREWRNTMDVDVLRSWAIDAQRTLAGLLLDFEQANSDVVMTNVELGAATSSVQKVRELHEPVEALNVRYNRVQKVCAACGTDDGNFQLWPCPTIRLIGGAS